MPVTPSNETYFISPCGRFVVACDRTGLAWRFSVSHAGTELRVDEEEGEAFHDARMFLQQAMAAAVLADELAGPPFQTREDAVGSGGRPAGGEVIRVSHIGIALGLLASVVENFVKLAGFVRVDNVSLMSTSINHAGRKCELFVRKVKAGEGQQKAT